MDFSRTQLSGLLNNTAHEKTKYIAMLHKLKILLSLNKDHKLILTAMGKLVFTSIPSELYNHVNYKHPFKKILTEYLAKLSKCPTDSPYFIDVVKALIDQVVFLLDHGIKPKRISDTFKDVALGIKHPSVVVDNGNEFISQKTCSFIKQVMKNDYIADLLIDSIKTTRSYEIEKIRICKIGTGSLENSYKISGMVISRHPEGVVKRITNTSVGIFNCPFDINRTELKGTVLFRNHKDLLDFSKNETECIKKIVDNLNVNVLIVSGTVDSRFLDFADERNLLVLKVFNNFDLKRICDCVGGSIYNFIGPVNHKGFSKEVSAFEDGGFTYTKIIGETDVNTIVLKCSVKEVLDEVERLIINTLESLKKCKNFYFSDKNFHNSIISKIGKDDAVRTAMCKAISVVNDTELLIDNKIMTLKYAIDFLATLLEIDDYLVAKKDVLDIKPPKPDGHWDEDH